VVAVAVKAGQAPLGLAAGEHVLLVPVPNSGTSTTAAAGPAGAGGSSAPAGSTASPWSGVVAAVAPATTLDDVTVVSVELATAAARAVAGLPSGQIDLVLVPGP
jgi:hypothetical protein